MEELSDVESIGMGPEPGMDGNDIDGGPSNTAGAPGGGLESPEGRARDNREAVTPEQAAEAAAAAAELATLEAGGAGGRGRNTAGEQALMGASNEDGNVNGYEVVDESGDMVSAAFVDFLMN